MENPKERFNKEICYFTILLMSPTPLFNFFSLLLLPLLRTPAPVATVLKTYWRKRSTGICICMYGDGSIILLDLFLFQMKQGLRTIIKFKGQMA